MCRQWCGCANMKWIRLSLIAGSVSLSVWAVISGQFRDAEGFFTGGVTFPIAGAIALLTLLLGSFAGIMRSGAWVALGLMGQAAALQLIEAGSTVRYQHYAPPEVLLSRGRVGFLAILAVQAGICAIAFIRAWPALLGWARTAFSAWKLACIAVVFVLASAALSRSPSAYAFELIFATIIQFLALNHRCDGGACSPEFRAGIRLAPSPPAARP